MHVACCCQAYGPTACCQRTQFAAAMYMALQAGCVRHSLTPMLTVSPEPLTCRHLMKKGAKLRLSRIPSYNALPTIMPAWCIRDRLCSPQRLCMRNGFLSWQQCCLALTISAVHRI